MYMIVYRETISVTLYELVLIMYEMKKSVSFSSHKVEKITSLAEST